jgi:hypothetical protein
MKYVTLSNGQNGWTSNGGSRDWFITDPDVNANSTIITTISHPSGGAPAPICGVAYVQNPGTGFMMRCDIAPLAEDKLNYIVFSK